MNQRTYNVLLILAYQKSKAKIILILKRMDLTLKGRICPEFFCYRKTEFLARLRHVRNFIKFTCIQRMKSYSYCDLIKILGVTKKLEKSCTKKCSAGISNSIFVSQLLTSKWVKPGTLFQKPESKLKINYLATASMQKENKKK